MKKRRPIGSHSTKGATETFSQRSRFRQADTLIILLLRLAAKIGPKKHSSDGRRPGVCCHLLSVVLRSTVSIWCCAVQPQSQLTGCFIFFFHFFHDLADGTPHPPPPHLGKLGQVVWGLSFPLLSSPGHLILQINPDRDLLAHCVAPSYLVSNGKNGDPCKILHIPSFT